MLRPFKLELRPNWCGGSRGRVDRAWSPPRQWRHLAPILVSFADDEAAGLDMVLDVFDVDLAAVEDAGGEGLGQERVRV